MVIIYLSIINDTPLESLQFVIQSSPTKVWVYRLRGLPRSTNLVSQIVSSLWHFQEYFGIVKDRSHFFSAVTYQVGAPPYFFSASTNTTGIAACASMDLPNITKVTLDYPKLTDEYYILFDFKLQILIVLIGIGIRCPKNLSFQISHSAR